MQRLNEAPLDLTSVTMNIATGDIARTSTAGNGISRRLSRSLSRSSAINIDSATDAREVTALVSALLSSFVFGLRCDTKVTKHDCFCQKRVKVWIVHRVQCERVFMPTTVVVIDPIKHFLDRAGLS